MPNNTVSTVPNISSTTNSSNVIPPSKLDASPKIEDDSSITLYSKEINNVPLPLHINSQQNNSVLTSLDSLKSVNLQNDIEVDKIDTVHQTLSHDILSQISEPLSSSYLPDFKNINEFSINSSVSSETIKYNNTNIELYGSESNIEIINSDNCDNVSIVPSLPNCLSDNASSICTQNCTTIDLPLFLISDSNHEIVVDNILLSQKLIKPNNSKVVDCIGITKNENIIGTSTKQEHEICLEDEVVDSSISELELETEYNTICPNYCLDDSFTSGPLTDKEEQNSNNINEELTIQQRSESVNKSQEIVENKEKRKKKKKKVLDVDECSWEDLYDKEDDYIHPLLMKEVSLCTLYSNILTI